MELVAHFLSEKGSITTMLFRKIQMKSGDAGSIDIWKAIRGNRDVSSKRVISNKFEKMIAQVTVQTKYFWFKV